MAIRFGPAGLGGVKEAIANLHEYHKLGLRACEVAFTYGIYLNKEQAVEIGAVARELGIQLSIHAPYWINLNSREKKKVEESKKRILDCCEIGAAMGADCVVFHPGFYNVGKNKLPLKEGRQLQSTCQFFPEHKKIARFSVPENQRFSWHPENPTNKPHLLKQGKQEDFLDRFEKEESFQNIKKQIAEILKIIKEKKWKIEIAPETTGKLNVFGSVDEISRLVDETNCFFCVDFAHILAKEKKIDYKYIFSKLKDRKLHLHFSGIEYGEKGEKNHKLTDMKQAEDLLKNIPQNVTTVINESPNPVGDSVKMLSLCERLGICK